MKKIFTIFYLAFLSTTLPAQENLFEVGAILGGSAIGGDLVKSDLGSINEVNLVYGLMVRRYFHTNVAARLSVVHTKLTSQAQQFDRFGSQTLRSETPLTEVSIDGMYDILGHQRDWLSKSGGISPYVYLGFGLSFTNPKLIYSFENDNLDSDQNAGFSKTRIVVPFGIGGRWNFSEKGTLVLEIGARPTFSDYLDGVSIAGNPNKNDWYGVGGIQFWYKLSK